MPITRQKTNQTRSTLVFPHNYLQVHWAYHNCGDSLKSEIQDYAKKKLSRLQRLLARFRPSLRDLSLTVYRTKQASGDHFEVHVVLQLPSHTLVSKELADFWWEAVDLALDALTQQLRRHKARLRREWLHRRMRRQKKSLSVVGLPQDGEQLRQNTSYQPATSEP